MWNKPSFSSDQPHAKPRRHHSEYRKDPETVEKYNTNLDQGGLSKPPQARVQNGAIEKQTSRKGENRRTGPNDPNFNRLSSCLPAPRFHSDDRVRADGGRTVSRLLRRRGGTVPRRHLSRHANLTLALSILLKGPNIHDVHFICHDVLCLSTTYMPSFG